MVLSEIVACDARSTLTPCRTLLLIVFPAMPRLSVRFLESYLVTHDGIDLESFDPMTTGVFHKTAIPLTSANRRYHDQLQRSNYLTFGGGVGLAMNGSMEVFVDAAKMVWGESVHPLRAVTIGVNTHFSTRRAPHP